MSLNELDAPLGREKVVPCYGILGVLSLATSTFLIYLSHIHLFSTFTILG